MDFGIGIMNDIFAACGNVPVFRERLNSLVTTGVIVTAVALSMWAEIPSGHTGLCDIQGLKE